jgi:hypothetical protein
MARTQGDPNRLIARLNAALANAKPRDTADAGLMAEIAGMTWRNLVKTYIEPDKDFPIAVRGAEGVPWEFNVRIVLRHMIKRAQDRIDSNRREVSERARKLSFIVPDEEDGALDFTGLARLADLTYRVVDEKKSQGEWMQKSSHRAIVGGLLIAVRDKMQGAISKIDPAGKLPPDVRAALGVEVSNILLDCHREAAKFLEEQRAPIQSKGSRRPAVENRAR